MIRKEVPSFQNRRDFLSTLIPVCTFSCIGSKALFATNMQEGNLQQSNEEHKFDNKVDWTFKQVFERQYSTYIDRLNRLAKFIGRDKLIDFLKKSTVEFYGSLETYNPENTLTNFIQPFKENNYFKTILTIKFIEDTEKAVSWKLTECLHATIFRENDAADIGYATLCHGDDAWVTAYNPNIKFYRTKTLMEGHDCCDHRYVLKT